jgi:hypothetical protein
MRWDSFTKVTLIALATGVLGVWFVPRIQFLSGIEVVLTILILLMRKVTNGFEVLGLQAGIVGAHEPTVNTQNFQNSCAVKLTLPLLPIPGSIILSRFRLSVTTMTKLPEPLLNKKIDTLSDFYPTSIPAEFDSHVKNEQASGV